MKLPQQEGEIPVDLALGIFGERAPQRVENSGIVRRKFDTNGPAVHCSDCGLMVGI